jgi:hypothetical protein
MDSPLAHRLPESGDTTVERIVGVYDKDNVTIIWEFPGLWK